MVLSGAGSWPGRRRGDGHGGQGAAALALEWQGRHRLHHHLR